MARRARAGSSTRTRTSAAGRGQAGARAPASARRGVAHAATTSAGSGKRIHFLAATTLPRVDAARGPAEPEDTSQARAENLPATRAALDGALVTSIYDRKARRHDRLHGLLTLHSDQGGRLLVDEAVTAGDCVLDAGGGIGSTALLAAERVGPAGKIVVLDASVSAPAARAGGAPRSRPAPARAPTP